MKKHDRTHNDTTMGPLEVERLSNQLNVLFIDQKAAQCGSVQMWFRAGSSLEEKGDEGIAHFLEHMFFKGTPKRPGAQIASEVESFGGEINAFTSFDYTCYYINFPSPNIKESIHILLDMVSHPEFLEKELVPERNVVFEEYKKSLDNPHHDHFHRIQKNCFLGGYAHPILGKEQSIKNFSRNQLTKFRKNHYNSDNSLFIVAGDIEQREQIKKIILQYRLPEGPLSKFLPFRLKTKPQIDVYEKDVQMVQTTLTIPASLYEKKEGAYEDLAINAIGCGESSLLHQKLVVETSLANKAGGSSMFMVNGGGHFIRLVCPLRNLSKVYDEFIKLIKRLLEKGIAEEDIQKIKNQYVASKVYEKESLESLAFSFGHSYAQNGDINCEAAFIDHLKSCSSHEAHQSLLNIFRRPIHVNVQIPRGIEIDGIRRKASLFQKKLQSFDLQSQHDQKRFQSKASKFDPQVRELSLKKGIRFIHRYNPLTPTFNLYAFIKGGLSEERKKNNGLYYILGHLLGKGYKGKSYHRLKLDLDKMSSSLSGFSGRNSYGLGLHGLSDHSHNLFEIFFKSLINPLFLSKSFNHEIKIAQRELLNQEEDPAKQCFKLVNKILFAGHSYSMPLMGSRESLTSLARQEIVDIHEKKMKSEEILISFSGNIKLEECLSLITPFIDQFKERREKRTTKRQPTPNLSTIKTYKHHKAFQREQAHIFVGMRAFRQGHPNNLFIKMLTAHLSGQSSELFVRVRDQEGLCYVVQPIHFAALEAGYWGIYIASGIEKTQKALEAINEILDDYSHKGLGKKEFDRVKSMIQGQDLLNIQTNEDYTQIYSIPVLHGRGLDEHHQFMQKIQNSTRDEFNRVIRSFLSKKRVTVVIG
ncbi:MAG: pitrilysin family protein [Bacteriovoracales bacterium]|nr:pitrilysin family protein [Bacteriovoracales bacterium]